jgi:hypothetical protein
MTYDLTTPIEYGVTPERAMRQIRANLLAASDWTQMPDSPLTDEQRAAWATYRQALRDAPANWTPAPTWDAPEPPGGV